MARTAAPAPLLALALALGLSSPPARADEAALRAFLEADRGARIAGVAEIGGPWRSYSFGDDPGARASGAEFALKGRAFAVLLDGGRDFYHFSRLRVLTGGAPVFSMPVEGDYQQCRVLPGPASVQIEVYAAIRGPGALALSLAVVNSFDGAEFQAAFAEDYFSCDAAEGGRVDYKLIKRGGEGTLVRYEAWRGAKAVEDPGALLRLLGEKEAFDVSFLGAEGTRLETVYTLKPPAPR